VTGWPESRRLKPSALTALKETSAKIKAENCPVKCKRTPASAKPQQQNSVSDHELVPSTTRILETCVAVRSKMTARARMAADGTPIENAVPRKSRGNKKQREYRRSEVHDSVKMETDELNSSLAAAMVIRKVIDTLGERPGREA
jgi:hypothetical protein